MQPHTSKSHLSTFDSEPHETDEAQQHGALREATGAPCHEQHSRRDPSLYNDENGQAKVEVEPEVLEGIDLPLEGNETYDDLQREVDGEEVLSSFLLYTYNFHSFSFTFVLFHDAAAPTMITG